MVDFDLGKNSLVFVTDKNNVYWSGLGLAYKPIKFEIPKEAKIVGLSASNDCFAALD